MEQQCIWNMKQAINKLAPSIDTNKCWPLICQMVELLRPTPLIKKVLWQKSPQGTFKVNTDGRCNATDGKAGIGGIVRDSDGKLIMAFSIAIQCNSNIMAEALAAEFGGKWCTLQGYTNFIMELDSEVITNMLKTKATNNLKLKMVIDRIIRETKHNNVTFLSQL